MMYMKRRFDGFIFPIFGFEIFRNILKSRSETVLDLGGLYGMCWSLDRGPR